MTFVKADVNAFRPRADLGGFDYGDAGSSSFGTAPAASVEPRFPKSLFLVQPLSGAYELNPVAGSAQESVPVPDGLDLNAWIVPPPKEETPIVPREASDNISGDGNGNVAEESSKPKKGKKGKGKDVVGGKAKGKRKAAAAATATGADTLAAPPETPEERAERERVRPCFQPSRCSVTAYGRVLGI